MKKNNKNINLLIIKKNQTDLDKMKIIKGTKENKRVYAKTLYFTYSQIQQIKSKLEIKNFFLNKLKLKKKFNALVISYEAKGKKLHILINLENRFNIKNTDSLILKLEDKQYMPTYIPTKSFINEKNRLLLIDNESLLEENLANEKSPEEIAIDLFQSKKMSINEIINWYAKEHKSRVYNNLNKLKNTLKTLEDNNKIEKEDKPALIELPCTFEEANFEDEELKKFLKELAEKNFYNRTLLTIGDPGLGKTLLSKLVSSLLSKFQEKFKDILFISEKQQLKHLNKDNYKIVLFDEVDFDDIKNQEFINLIDQSEDRALRILYGSAKKEKGVNVLLTTNEIEPLLKKIKNKKILDAILRRTIVIRLKSSIKPGKKTDYNIEKAIFNIYGNVNVNIYVNPTLNQYHMKKEEFDNFHAYDMNHPLTLANKKIIDEILQEEKISNIEKK